MKHILTAIATLLPLMASAQNLDPTVEVSRTYEGKLMEVHKPQLNMAVPDSVLRFDLDFDYSVMDTPYRGAYEFSPYVMEMKPSPTVYDHTTFSLKAGAGYQLHPVVDMRWTPKFRTNAFRMNVYASHNSFIGNYWKMVEPVTAVTTGVLDRMGPKGADGRTWAGYDMDTKAGVNGRADWEKGLFTFDLGYRGLHQKDSYMTMMTRSNYALGAKVGVASKKQTGFLYRADLAYEYVNDDLVFTYGDIWDQEATEIDFASSWGYALAGGARVLVDFDFNTAFVSNSRGNEGTAVDIAPRYVRSTDRWHLDLGVRFSGGLATSFYEDSYGVDGQIVYPDVRIEYKMIRNAMKLYADIGGGAELVSYSDVLKYNRRAYSGFFWRSDVMDVSEERINAAIGAEGRIGSRFSYDLRGGFVNYTDWLMDGVRRKEATSVEPAIWLPTLGYGTFNKAYAALDWLLDTESVRLEGNVEYSYSWSKNAENINGYFLPAALKGEVSFMYDWKDRIFAGVDCGFSSARRGTACYYEMMLGGGPVEMEYMDAEVPGYADLGVNLKYAVNRKFSVWARGGNLLGMTIQRDILYAEKGPYFTAGVCLNL